MPPRIVLSADLDLTAWSSNVEKYLRDISRMTTQTRAMAASSSGAIGGVGNTLAVTIGNLAANVLGSIVSTLREVSGQVIETVGFFENLSVAVTYYTARSIQAADTTLSMADAMAQAGEEAQATMLWIQELSILSPFNVEQVANAFRTAQAYGLTKQQVQGLLPLLVDFVSINNLAPEILNRIVLAVAQIATRGKLAAQEINQLANAGFPLREILSKSLGIAQNKIDELLQKGLIPAGPVLRSIIDYVKQFDGYAEKIARTTLTGLISSFKDLIKIGTFDFFEGISKVAVPRLNDLLDVLMKSDIRGLLTVMGQDAGKLVARGIEALIQAVQGLISAFGALSPQTIQTIGVIVIATTSILAMTAAVGLLSMAINILITPYTLLVAAAVAVVVAMTRVDEIAASLESTFVALGQSIERGFVFFIHQAIGALQAYDAATAGVNQAALTGITGAITKGIVLLDRFVSDAQTRYSAAAKLIAAPFEGLTKTIAGVNRDVLDWVQAMAGRIIATFKSITTPFRVFGTVVRTLMGVAVSQLAATFKPLIDAIIDANRQIRAAASEVVFYLIADYVKAGQLAVVVASRIARAIAALARTMVSMTRQAIADWGALFQFVAKSPLADFFIRLGLVLRQVGVDIATVASAIMGQGLRAWSAFFELLTNAAGGPLLAFWTKFIAVLGVAGEFFIRFGLILSQVGKDIVGTIATITRQGLEAWGIFFAGVASLSRSFIEVMLKLEFILGQTFHDIVALFTKMASSSLSTYSRFGRGIGTITVTVLRTLGDLVKGVVDFGVAVVQAFSQGIVAGLNILSSALQALGKVFDFWLKPGSPPRAIPKLDEYAYKTGAGYAKTLHEGIVQTFTSFPPIPPSAAFKTGPIAPANVALHPERLHGGINASTLFQLGPQSAIDLNKKIEAGLYKAAEDSADAATDAGFQVGNDFIQGFIKGFPAGAPKIDDELAELLQRFGGGPKLKLSGTAAFNSYLEGFKEGDFGVLDDIAGTVNDFLSVMVDVGKIDDLDLPAKLFGSREAIARSIQELRKGGAITTDTMKALKRATGDVSGDVVALLTSYANLSVFTERVEAAQARLNAITKHYKDIITPLRRELELISEASRLQDEQEQILSLQRTINNQASSARQRQQAQIKIDEIIAEQRVRQLEAERDAKLESAQETLDTAKEGQDTAQKQYDLVQARIQAQIEQLSLVGQESAAYRQLEEQIDKLIKKQKTQIELQLELMKLQSDELSDLVKAGHAKYILGQADSTALERQQAILDLQNVALSRNKRLEEVANLGFPQEELTKFYDTMLTLKDIGINGSAMADMGDASEAFAGIIEDVNEKTALWTAELERARKKWDDIKEAVTFTARRIDDELPSFLKIFPKEKGETPPLILNLERLTVAVIAYVTAMKTYAVIKTIKDLVAVLGSLAVAQSAAGAAGAAGGAAAAGAQLTWFGELIVGLGALALAAGGAYASLLALKGIVEFFAPGQQKAFKKNEQAESLALGATQEGLQQATNRLLGNIGPLSSDTKQLIAERITFGAVDAIQTGLGSANTIASIQATVDRIVAEGMIADTPANRQAIATFQSNIATLFNTTPTGGRVTVNMLHGADLVATPTPEQTTAVQKSVGDFLGTMVGTADNSPLATNIKTLVSDAAQLGFDQETIRTYAYNAFNAGVAAGLVADTPEMKKAIDQYITGVIASFQKQSESDSPSQLMAREVGHPLGQGVVQGINDIFSSSVFINLVTNTVDRVVGAFTKMRDTAVRQTTDQHGVVVSLYENMRAQAANNSEQMRVTVSNKVSTLRIFVVNQVGIMTSTVETDIDGMVTSVLLAFDRLNTNIAPKLASFKDAVLTALVGSNPDSMAMQLLAYIAGTATNPESGLGFLLGDALMDGMVRGIQAGEQDVADALVKSLASIAATAKGTPAVPSFQTATPFPNYTPYLYTPRPAQITPSSGTTINTTNNYNLNVTSAASSQGIVSDFTVIRTLA